MIDTQITMPIRCSWFVKQNWSADMRRLYQKGLFGAHEAVDLAFDSEADRMKLLPWDGTGLVLVAKRLEKSSFRWPRISDGVMRLTSSQLSALLEGLDWTRVRAVRVPVPQATL